MAIVDKTNIFVTSEDDEALELLLVGRRARQCYTWMDRICGPFDVMRGDDTRPMVLVAPHVHCLSMETVFVTLSIKTFIVHSIGLVSKFEPSI